MDPKNVSVKYSYCASGNQYCSTLSIFKVNEAFLWFRVPELNTSFLCFQEVEVIEGAKALLQQKVSEAFEQLW